MAAALHSSPAMTSSSLLALESADSRRPSGRSLLVAYLLAASTPVVLWAATEPVLAAAVAAVLTAAALAVRAVVRPAVTRSRREYLVRTPWADVRIEV
jgi:hypothetical protein